MTRRRRLAAWAARYKYTLTVMAASAAAVICQCIAWGPGSVWDRPTSGWQYPLAGAAGGGSAWLQNWERWRRR